MGKEVVTEMMRTRGISREQAEAYQRKDLRLPAHQEPQDIAKVVAWLLSTQSPAEWLSGAGIPLYGGVR